MRGNNRKSIEKFRKKLSQFTTMNVIDGQAGLIMYTSLIFYSLTIDNILNIIVLLILAGVTISTLTGENGILTKASTSKEQTEIGQIKDRAKVDIIGVKAENEGKITDEQLKTVLNKYFKDVPSTLPEDLSTVTLTAKDEYGGHSIPLTDIYERETGGTNFKNIDTAETNPAGSMPSGATVVEADGSKGIVIKDTNNNEWTWIEVPKSIYNNSAYYTNGASKPADKTDHDNIEKIMQNYATDYRNSSRKDEFYSTEQHGFANAGEYNNWKYNMLESVYENGGFYIGKYEVGYELAEGERVRNYGSDYSTEHPTTQTPVIKQNAYPYNWVRCSQAQTLSKSLATGGKTSGLMFGIQWDLVLKYLEVKGNWDTTTNTASYYLKTNSGTWGNYSNVSFDITNTNAKYSEDYGATFNTITGTYTKPSFSSRLLTTGATERNSKLNIYDLAGNLWEWTLEYTSNSTDPCTRRGAYYNNYGSSIPSSDRSNFNVASSGSYNGFRPSLY